MCCYAPDLPPTDQTPDEVLYTAAIRFNSFRMFLLRLLMNAETTTAAFVWEQRGDLPAK
jgi:hypothetical protein